MDNENTINAYEGEKLIPVELNKEMKKSYIDYAMSVIVGRALPDVRDGLKPVHRRILYSMYEDGYTSDKPYKKCATTVGAVLGKYHPHGDASVYDAMVRLAQDFSMRYPLVDGHGNFGSIDGDAPAAYRYTESRMSKLSEEMLTDIEKETVTFSSNFDESRKEPDCLPSKFPNLLLNGSSGIAVGMATNIPPHNLREVCNCCIEMLDNPDMDVDEIMQYIKGPDFPTKGIIMGVRGIRSYFATGRGKMIVRAKTEIVDNGNKQEIIVTEIPYQVNKTRLLESIVNLMKNKVIEGISYINDESGMAGMKIVIELKHDANANVVLNKLYKHTSLQETFSTIMLAIDKGVPKVMPIKDVIVAYLNHQKDVIVRRTRFDLEKAQKRAHILEGLKIAVDHIDAIIKTIRASSNLQDAKNNLMEGFGLSDAQSQAIIEMRLGRLTGLARQEIEDEYQELVSRIEYYNNILSDENMVKNIVKDELTKITEKYGDDRRTAIELSEQDIDIEDLIPLEENIVTLTHFGYVKRLPVDTYKTQRRGGRGISGMSTREEDFAEDLFAVSSHDHLLFFTNKARVHRIKTYEIPEASRTAKGTAIVNLLQLEPDETVTTLIPIKDMAQTDKYLVMITKKGVIKRSPLKLYNSNKKSGLNALKLDEGDELISVKLTDGKSDIIVGTHLGMAVRFSEEKVRSMGRITRGVRAINLKEDDYVASLNILDGKEYLLTVTEKGLGKKTSIEDYRITSRGCKGIKNYAITEKTGNVVGLKAVTDDDDIILINTEGVVIRLHSADIRKCGRVAQGVKLMRTSEDVSVAAMACVAHDEDEEVAEIEDNTIIEGNPEDMIDDPDSDCVDDVEEPENEPGEQPENENEE
ncbi:MAG: DNA gyrase subunit A [Bacillota bacterium]|nr:DNA gyrase subunit A [Bacillota bacterium]